MKKNRIFFLAAVFVIAWTFAQAAGAQQGDNSKSIDAVFTCGSKLESDAWLLWDERGFELAKGQLIEKRLLGSGDSYALYDFETSFHNLLDMAQRCARADRQQQIANLIDAAYRALSTLKGQPGRAWVCRGGAICNVKNRLLDTEVVLNSTQFLALATDAANGLREKDCSSFAQDFCRGTAQIALEHLIRWSNPSARDGLRKRIGATPADIKDGSSALFLMDSDLWQVATYSNLAGILAARPQVLKESGVSEEEFESIKEHLTLLLRLIKARTALQDTLIDGKKAVVADLDEGFRRLHADNRFAGYSGNERPISCARGEESKGGEKKHNLQKMAENAEPVGNLGLDISHARRLVHLFNALERNRDALIHVFRISSSDLPSHGVIVAFARQLRLKVWNQDRERPLFSNYFNGSNGWYRVGYGNEKNPCAEGYPPFGLSNSFPTGGYVTWSAAEPMFGILGRQIYALTQSTDKSSQAFVEKYYANLRASTSGDAQVVEKLMFWPSLIIR